MKRLYIIERFFDKYKNPYYKTLFSTWDYKEAYSFFKDYKTLNQLTLDEGVTFKMLHVKN